VLCTHRTKDSAMENTVSDVEKARLPGATENELIMLLGTAAFPMVLGQPVIADVDRIVTTVDWTVVALTIAAQPDCPRNITATLTDADNSVTGLLTITGEDAQGRTVVETMAPNGAGGGKTLVGTKIFAKVVSAVITLATGATTDDEVVIGVGDVIGIPIDLSWTVSVTHTYLGGTRIASPTLTAGVSTSGVNVSASTYNGTKVLLVFVKPTKRA